MLWRSRGNETLNTFKPAARRGRTARWHSESWTPSDGHTFTLATLFRTIYTFLGKRPDRILTQVFTQSKHNMTSALRHSPTDIHAPSTAQAPPGLVVVNTRRSLLALPLMLTAPLMMLPAGPADAGVPVATAVRCPGVRCAFMQRGHSLPSDLYPYGGGFSHEVRYLIVSARLLPGQVQEIPVPPNLAPPASNSHHPPAD